jgi:hypothetical protein
MGSLSIAGGRSMGITDEEASLIDLCDPYADTAWSGARLSTFERTLRERAASLREEAVRRVCAELYRETVEEWMLPLIERACAEDGRIALLERIAAIAADALRENAVLSFEGD